MRRFNSSPRARLLNLIAVVVVGLCPSLPTKLIGGESSLDDAVNVLQGSELDEARQPQLAISSQGDVAIAFGIGTDVYCVTSRAAIPAATTSGDPLQFLPPVKIGSIPKLALGMRRGPRIAWTDDAIVVTALGHDDGNVWSWRSTNRGETWQGPLQVNDSQRSAREGLHAMAAGPAGLIYCVWLDLRSGRTEVYGAASRDGGATWSPNQRVYHSPSGTICECCHPSVAIDAKERILVLFRNSLDGNRDMFLNESRDDGQSFSEAKRLGFAAWKLKACPMDGGAVAVTPQGDVITTWRRESEVFRTSKGIGEQLLGRGEQPWVATSESGVFLAWLSSRGSALRLQSPADLEPTVLAESAADPVLASVPGGKAPVVAAWEAELDGQRVIMAKVIEQRK